jgi:uncharacterized damage-inducible protein DinB
MKEEFIRTFDTGLNKLKKEVEQYAEEETLWSVSEGINNSAGNLCLHLIGNLNHYIGAKLGETGYIRDRPSEFTSKNISRAEILQKIDQTAITLNESLSRLSEEDLESWYPNDEGDEPRTVAAELLNIVTHFNYHLGQINYHRRLSS